MMAFQEPTGGFRPPHDGGRLGKSTVEMSKHAAPPGVPTTSRMPLKTGGYLASIAGGSCYSTPAGQRPARFKAPLQQRHIPGGL